jgi:hypothetical protein
MDINIIILSLILVVILSSICSLLLKIWKGDLEKNQIFWFWIIIGVPLFGSLAYFAFHSKFNQEKRVFMSDKKKFSK